MHLQEILNKLPMNVLAFLKQPLLCSLSRPLGNLTACLFLN